jgi:hypothetical protein
MTRLEPASGVEFEFMGTDETGLGAEELPLPLFQLMASVSGEVPDEFVLPGHQTFKVDGHRAGGDAPGASSVDGVAEFGGMEERLGGHAAAQDAETSDLGAAIEDGNAVPSSG